MSTKPLTNAEQLAQRRKELYAKAREEHRQRILKLQQQREQQKQSTQK